MCRPGDGKIGDDVALQRIALLGEGHYMTLIQQLVTGQISTSATTVTGEADMPEAFAPPLTWADMTRRSVWYLCVAASRGASKGYSRTSVCARVGGTAAAF